jgi:hypothetical protein
MKMTAGGGGPTPEEKLAKQWRCIEKLAVHPKKRAKREDSIYEN